MVFKFVIGHRLRVGFFGKNDLMERLNVGWRMLTSQPAASDFFGHGCSATSLVYFE